MNVIPPVVFKTKRPINENNMILYCLKGDMVIGNVDALSRWATSCRSVYLAFGLPFLIGSE